MKRFLNRWLWEGKQKWLTLFFLFAFIFWIFAYFSVFFLKDLFCTSTDDICIDFWLDTIGAPFYWGFLLKSMMISAVLLLPFSKRVFIVWATMSAIFLPWLFYRIIFVVPIVATYFTKTSVSDVWGDIYLALTVGIIVVVSLGEFLWKKFKK